METRKRTCTMCSGKGYVSSEFTEKEKRRIEYLKLKEEFGE